MLIASVSLLRADWLWPVSGLLAIFLGFLIWSYFRTQTPPGLRLACLGLKSVGVAAVLLCLLEPAWNHSRARPGANYFAIMADNSQGLQIHDLGRENTRGDWLKSVLAARPKDWQEHLGETFQLRRYQFDSQLRNVRDFAELRFDGVSSALRSSLRSLAERYEGQPLAGVLLMTDGNATDLSDSESWEGLPPIYPLIVGEDQPIPDIALQRISVRQTAFEEAPVTIQADIQAAGFNGKKVRVELWEFAPATNPPAGDGVFVKVREQVASADTDAAFTSVRFQTRPSRPGLSFYRVEVVVAEAGHPVEATQANNSRVIVVDRGRGPFRILYVSGRPNWEFKFLNRALAEDAEVELVGLIRVAKREPKFQFRGRAGESSNPLFRGFGQQDEGTERYDQPVLVRLNTRDQSELLSGFPVAAEDLFAYDALLLDDLEAEFFKHDQLRLIERFVAERGGGLLMMGGQESFRQGSYERTPLAGVLPVYIDRPIEQLPSSRLKFDFTREGWLEPWVRLRERETEEHARLESLPTFSVINRVREIKPGAQVLAVATDGRNTKFPALVAQRFGNGRSAALLLGDFWRAGLADDPAPADLAKAWRQTMRWLVTDVPRRVEVTAKPDEQTPDAVTLQIRVRDKSFQPLDTAQITLSVRHLPASNAAAPETGATGANTNRTGAIQIGVQPAPAEAGLYTATYIPRENGAYIADAVVTDDQGAALGQATVGWASEPAAEEFKSLLPNRSLLELIAAKTGGHVVTPEQLESFAQGLPKRRAPVMETTRSPLWHHPSLFLFALVCFISEWGLRRWKGLP